MVKDLKLEPGDHMKHCVKSQWKSRRISRCQAEARLIFIGMCHRQKSQTQDIPWSHGNKAHGTFLSDVNQRCSCFRLHAGHQRGVHPQGRLWSLHLQTSDPREAISPKPPVEGNSRRGGNCAHEIWGTGRLQAGLLSDEVRKR